MTKLSLLSLAVLALLSCKQPGAHTEPDYPALPEYPRVSVERSFKVDGADTLWLSSTRYSYDSLGRYDKVQYFDEADHLVYALAYAYEGSVATITLINSAGQPRTKYVYTYLDDSYQREPLYVGPYYRDVVHMESYDVSGVQRSAINYTRDAYLRVTQTDGFNIESGTFYNVNLYYPYGADFTQVKHPKSDHETRIQGSCTYADSLCRYELTHTTVLEKGSLTESYTYDDLGRRTSHVGHYAGMTTDSTQYIYHADREYEINHLDQEQIVRYYLK